MDFLFNEIVVLVISSMFVLYIAFTLYYANVLKRKEKEKYKEEILSLAHEVKNPLSVCKGYIEIMNKKNSYSKKHVKIIEGQINECLNIMNDYLSLRKEKINLDYIDIGLLLDDVCLELKDLVNERNIKINLKGDDDELIVKGDYIKLKEVFYNVLKNSIEAKENGKNLTVNIRLKSFDGNVFIEIKDNGCGLESGFGNKYYTNKVLGNGIGVMLIKNIIRLHKGNVEYIKKRKGTLVKINLPLAI